VNPKTYASGYGSRRQEKELAGTEAVLKYVTRQSEGGEEKEKPEQIPLRLCHRFTSSNNTSLRTSSVDRA
jgi:hypothetical protein